MKPPVESASRGWTLAIVGRLRRRPVACASLLVLFATGTVGAVLHDGGMVGDQALIELQTRDVFSSSTPLTGPYSRYGWAHPGPMLFLLLSPMYFLLGATGTSLMIAMAAVNAAFGAVCVALVERLHQRWALAALGLLALTLVLADEAVLAVPWNPRATVVPIVLLLIAATFASLGDDLSAGVLVVVTVFIVSAHAGVGVAMLPVAAVGLAAWWFRRRRWPPRWSVVSAVVFTTPLAVDVVGDWPGNPGRLVRFGLTDDSPQLGLVSAGRFVLRSASPEFLAPDRYDGFLGFVTPTQPLGWLPGLLLIVLTGLAWRGSTPTVTHAARLLIVGFIGAGVSISNIRGVPFEYLLIPLPVLAAIGWSLAAAEAWIRTNKRVPTNERTRRAVVLIGTVCLGVTASVAEVSRTHDDVSIARTIERATAAIVDIDDGSPIIIAADVGDPFALIQYFGGVMNELDRRGVDARVLAGTAEIVGSDRDGDPATTRQVTISVLPVDEEPALRGPVIFAEPTNSEDVVRLQVAPPAPTG